MSALRRSVSFATRGRISASKKAVTIATIGWIVIANQYSQPQNTTIYEEKQRSGAYLEDKRLETINRIKIEDSDIIAIVKITLKETII